MDRSSISKLCLAAGLAASVAGCYVVPIDSRGYPVLVQPPTPVAAAQPVPLSFQARLYPLNELAGKTGTLTATVTDSANGHAVFVIAYPGELLQGEASRLSGQRGIASASGPHGTYVNCDYA